MADMEVYHVTDLPLYEVWSQKYDLLGALAGRTRNIVLLVRNKETQRFYAMKVAQHDAESLHASEGAMLERLHPRESFHSEDFGREAIIRIVERWTTETDEVIVFPLAGRSLGEGYFSNGQLLPLLPARAIIAQLIYAIHFVHSKNIVHNDLKLHNVLLKRTQSVDLTHVSLWQSRILTEQPDQYFWDETFAWSLRPQEWAAMNKWQRFFYLAGHLHGVTERGPVTIENAQILLNDFDVAFSDDKGEGHPSKALLHYMPPENLCNPATWATKASDIWNLGNLIFNIIGREPLIAGSTCDETRSRYERDQSLLFGVDGMPNEHDSLFSDRWNEEMSIRAHMGREYALDLREACLLRNLIAQMLGREPEERFLSVECCEHAWMAEYGIPAMRQALAAGSHEG